MTSPYHPAGTGGPATGSTAARPASGLCGGIDEEGSSDFLRLQRGTRRGLLLMGSGGRDISAVEIAAARTAGPGGGHPWAARTGWRSSGPQVGGSCRMRPASPEAHSRAPHGGDGLSPRRAGTNRRTAGRRDATRRPRCSPGLQRRATVRHSGSAARSSPERSALGPAAWSRTPAAPSGCRTPLWETAAQQQLVRPGPTWDNYRNRFWPAKYLIDAQGTATSSSAKASTTRPRR